MNTQQTTEDRIAPGQQWRHRNGMLYEVVLFTNVKTTNPDKYPVTVVYKNVETGVVWSRPACNWYRSFTLENDA